MNLYRLLLLSPLLLTSIHAESWALDAREVYTRVTESGETLLFIDVRDPIEIMFTGFTDTVHANIPFRLVDPTRLTPDGRGFVMPINPDFLQQVRAALTARNLDTDSTIITLCRTGGARGRPSAAFLRENGFPNAFYVDNGFEGDPIPEGPRAGLRLLNGWKNAGLPWRLSFDGGKIHRPAAPEANSPAASD